MNLRKNLPVDSHNDVERKWKPKPFGDPKSDQLFDGIQRILHASAGIEISKDFRSVVVAKCPKQTNTRDCGIYTIVKMLHPAAGHDDGTLRYEYNDNIRELIRGCLQKNKITEELMETLRD